MIAWDHNGGGWRKLPAGQHDGSAQPTGHIKRKNESRPKMPKLNQDMANKVDTAEDGFKPIEEGIYVLQLAEDVSVHEGSKGPYWKWTFVVPEDAEKGAGRKFFNNTSLSEAAFFRIKETFAAFGVPTNTDTEDLVGRRVRAHIVVKTIQSGTRKGELGNEIAKLMPLDGPTDEVPAAGGGVSTAKADDAPLF